MGMAAKKTNHKNNKDCSIYARKGIFLICGKEKHVVKLSIKTVMSNINSTTAIV